MQRKINNYVKNNCRMTIFGELGPGDIEMKKELENKLFVKYPKIFVQKDLGPKETLMDFGVECGDGWYWLVDELCSCLQSHIDNNNHPQVEAVQIKEKFGGLRFYTGCVDDHLTGYIRFAEHLSLSICESCGTTQNVLKTEGWIRTICQGCFRKEKSQKHHFESR